MHSTLPLLLRLDQSECTLFHRLIDSNLRQLFEFDDRCRWTLDVVIEDGDGGQRPLGSFDPLHFEHDARSMIDIEDPLVCGRHDDVAMVFIDRVQWQFIENLEQNLIPFLL